MKTALVQDWLTGMRGGEKCLEVLCELFPDSDLFTIVHAPGSVSSVIENRQIITSFIQRLPASTRRYRSYLPLMPMAIEALDLNAYDLVISSSHCVAKGVIARPDAMHISYMHTPMRYVWDMWPQYVRNPYLRFLLSPVLTYLRSWDASSSSRVDHFVANSTFVADRIRKYYRRDSTVIHPPVDTEFFNFEGTAGDTYLVVSALVPYKSIDLAIRAFNELGRPLKVVGEGPLRKKLMALAGPNIEFTGWLPDEELRRCYASCRALVFPTLEDFGIVPLEANAAGRPVIALGRGGALDTVVPLNASPGSAPATGVFFHEQSVEALQAAVRYFEDNEGAFHPELLRRHARAFDRSIFKQRIKKFINDTLESLNGFPGQREERRNSAQGTWPDRRGTAIRP
jgi:glycosyltransferase involved in cell wall biosynthesis